MPLDTPCYVKERAKAKAGLLRIKGAKKRMPGRAREIKRVNKAQPARGKALAANPARAKGEESKESKRPRRRTTILDVKIVLRMILVVETDPTLKAKIGPTIHSATDKTPTLILRSGLRFLANFTSWARRLLDALQAWWEGLFGRGEAEPEAETEKSVHMPRPRPFASFTNPFLDGRDAQLSADALTRYSFEALQAWAWEQGLGRRRGETPLEFAERLGTDVPRLETEVRSLAGLYVRLAYARSSLTPGCLGLLKQFWQRLEGVEERSISV
jgi:hypothetical protein